VLAGACKSTQREIIQSGHVLGQLHPKNDHVVDVQFDSRKIQGEASGITVLWFFSFGPSNYSKNLAYEAKAEKPISLFDTFFGFGWLGALFPDLNGRIKSAAVREACDSANCDLLGFPMYYVDETDYILWKEHTWRVVGFPGMIQGMSNRDARIPSEAENIARQGDNVTIQIDAKR
jgi:hypothetical protein